MGSGIDVGYEKGEDNIDSKKGVDDVVGDV